MPSEILLTNLRYGAYLTKRRDESELRQYIRYVRLGERMTSLKSISALETERSEDKTEQGPSESELVGVQS